MKKEVCGVKELLVQKGQKTQEKSQSATGNMDLVDFLK